MCWGDEAPGRGLMRRRTYEIRLNGLVPTDELLEQVGNVDVAEQELRTVLSGRFTDQAELHGFLNRLRAYGLEVVEVRRVPSASDDEPAGWDTSEDSSDDTDDDRSTKDTNEDSP